jgi:hypothetical protein
MKMKKPLIVLFALGALMVTSIPADAQYNYYTSPQYQAEEQAFRARQNEGARLHETFGENSPQYMNWYSREKGFVPYGYGFNNYGPYYGNTPTFSRSAFNRARAKQKKQIKKRIKQQQRYLRR